MKLKLTIILFIILIIILKYKFNLFFRIIWQEIKAIKFLKNNKSYHDVTAAIINKTNLKIIRNKKASEISKNKTIFLVNHRSWADLWLDHYILNAVYISRSIIKKLFPFMVKLCQKSNDIIFFERNKKINKKKLYSDIKKSLNNNKNILLYPEGTRNKSNKSKPLKFGIIKLGYQEKIPFQICIVSNKENIVNEKKLKVYDNQTCEYFTSEIIHPKDYKTLKEFIDVIQKKWDESWNIIYNK